MYEVFLEKVLCSRTGTWPVEPLWGGCRRHLADTTPPSQPHFLVQYNRGFTTMWLHLNDVLGKIRVLHLCWYDDYSSWLDKSTWQMITCQVIWRGARKQGDKSTCQVDLFVKWNLSPQVGFATYERKLPASAGNFLLRIASASEKVFARFFGPFFGCSSLSKISVFGWTRCEIWLWHNPPHTSFPRYKKSGIDTGSTQKMGINKERESERFSHQRRRVSQWSCWLWIVYMFLESKIFLPDESLRGFNLDQTKNILFQNYFAEFNVS